MFELQTYHVYVCAHIPMRFNTTSYICIYNTILPNAPVIAYLYVSCDAVARAHCYATLSHVYLITYQPTRHVEDGCWDLGLEDWFGRDWIVET